MAPSADEVLVQRPPAPGLGGKKQSVSSLSGCTQLEEKMPDPVLWSTLGSMKCSVGDLVRDHAYGDDPNGILGDIDRDSISPDAQQDAVASAAGCVSDSSLAAVAPARCGIGAQPHLYQQLLQQQLQQQLLQQQPPVLQQQQQPMGAPQQEQHEQPHGFVGPVKPELTIVKDFGVDALLWSQLGTMKNSILNLVPGRDLGGEQYGPQDQADICDIACDRNLIAEGQPLTPRTAADFGGFNNDAYAGAAGMSAAFRFSRDTAGGRPAVLHPQRPSQQFLPHQMPQQMPMPMRHQPHRLEQDASPASPAGRVWEQADNSSRGFGPAAPLQQAQQQQLLQQLQQQQRDFGSQGYGEMCYNGMQQHMPDQQPQQSFQQWPPMPAQQRECGTPRDELSRSGALQQELAYQSANEPNPLLWTQLGSMNTSIRHLVPGRRCQFDGGVANHIQDPAPCASYEDQTWAEAAQQDPMSPDMQLNHEREEQFQQKGELQDQWEQHQQQQQHAFHAQEYLQSKQGPQQGQYQESMTQQPAPYHLVHELQMPQDADQDYSTCCEFLDQHRRLEKQLLELKKQQEWQASRLAAQNLN